MKSRTLFFQVMMLAPLLIGCGNELKKIQRKKGLSNACYLSLKTVNEKMKQYDNGKALILKGEYVATERKRSETIQQILESYYNNIGCWTENLTMNDVENIFGAPTKKVAGQRTGDLTFQYWIINKTCVVNNEDIVNKFDCGLLKFTFNKEKELYTGSFELKE